MEISGADRWLVDMPLHDGSRLGRSFQAVLKDTEATLRKSALRLRECGQEDGARRAERFAAWARFDLDEPAMAERLYLAAAELRRIRRPELLVGRVLETVLSLARRSGATCSSWTRRPVR